jgi:hypothetical protein
VQRLAFCKQAKEDGRKGRNAQKALHSPKELGLQKEREREATLNSLCIQSESQECL